MDEHNDIEKRKSEAHNERNYDLWLRLDAEQESLSTFTPWIMHSFSEGVSTVDFHFQVLADWNTVIEIADKFLMEL